MEKVKLQTTKALREYLVKHSLCAPVSEDADEETLQNVFGKSAARALACGELSTELYKSLMSEKQGVDIMSNSISEKMFSGSIRVKDPSESYDTKRHTAKNKNGQNVVDPIFGGVASLPSESDKAKTGVFIKKLAQKSGCLDALTESESNLFDELTQNDPWAGTLNGQQQDFIPGSKGMKALINDSTSGGINVVPIFLDTDISMIPLLNGELTPLVDIKPINSQTVQGANISAPTMVWGGQDASSISLFDTTDLINSVPSTVMMVQAAVEIGRNLLEDSPVALGDTITQLLGQRLGAELDRVLSSGNGTTEPMGIFTASGITSTTTENGNAGPITLDDLIEMYFALGKQYRTAQNKLAFLSNDTAYARMRALTVDPTGATNQQLVLGWPSTDMTGGGGYQYQTIGVRHAIQNDLANTVCALGAMNKVRLYRRIGAETRVIDSGQTLALRNTILICYRARYASAILDPGAFIKFTDGQS